MKTYKTNKVFYCPYYESSFMVPLSLFDFYSSDYRGDKLRKSPYDNSQVLSVINNADGRLEVFARNTNYELYHIWQTAPSNGWSSWDSMWMG